MERTNELKFIEKETNKKYDVYLDENCIGTMNRIEDGYGIWELQLPRFNIKKSSQYRHDLMEYVDIYISKIRNDK